jgi:hypothetical protein
MALDLTVTYFGQVTSGDAGYPFGKAKNVVVPGDGGGTPWEQQLVNDWFGFFQGLLDGASITPSGIPDTVLASDYLDALDARIDAHVFDGLVVTSGATITGGATIVGDVTLNNSLLIGGNITLLGALVVTGNVTLGNADTDVLTVEAGSQFNASATFADDILVPSTLAMSGVMTVTAGAVVLVDPGVTWTQGSRIALSGVGHIRERLIDGADADSAYGIEDADIIVFSSGTPRTYTLNATSASSGDKITIIHKSSATLTVAGLAAGGTQAMRNQSSGDVRVMTFHYQTGTGWLKSLQSFVP